MTVSWSDPARIILGSLSDRPRIGNDVSAVFEKIFAKFWRVILRGRRSIW